MKPGHHRYTDARKASRRDPPAEKNQLAAVAQLKALGFFSNVSARRRAAMDHVERELAVPIVEAAE